MAVGPGTILQSKYRIIELLGSGGMGQVWRGQDANLDRAVAIKVMQDHYSDQESFERFKREAQVAAKLDHPGITAVHDFGRHDNQYFIVMQLLKGQDLKATLKGHPMGLPVRQAVNYAIQAAEALAAAHESGVIHRDLKPANLFIVAREQLKICDFGIAKHVDATRTLTRPGEVIGTPAYMSPEQWSGRPVDAARTCTPWAACCTNCWSADHPSPLSNRRPRYGLSTSRPRRHRPGTALPSRRRSATSSSACSQRTRKTGRRLRPSWRRS